ncbi:MAG TPA: GyrI-like domain-containing protein [Planctomycetota bacterium]|nr:GyrI-like domain-containing protein [Planctomycetota bacterium]
MSYNVELIQVPLIHTAVIRSAVRPANFGKFVQACCGEVWTFAKTAGLPKPGRHVALYADGDGPVEVGVEVTAPFVGNQRVICSSLPAGRAVVTVHYGPYQLLGQAHDAILKWCAAQGLKRAGVCWEIYGHWDAAWNNDPGKIRTDVGHLVV